MNSFDGRSTATRRFSVTGRAIRVVRDRPGQHELFGNATTNDNVCDATVAAPLLAVARCDGGACP
jgi:hypothetical protein